MIHTLLGLWLLAPAAYPMPALKNRACSGFLTYFRANTGQTVDAWNILRVFRLRTFSPDLSAKIQPSAMVVRGFVTEPNRRVGARILGLEADYKNSETTPLTVGLVVEGREQILSAMNEIRETSNRWSIQLNGQPPSLNDPRKQIMLCGGVTFGLAELITSCSMGVPPIIQFPFVVAMSALAVVGSTFGPETLVRLASRVDFDFNTFLEVPDLEKIESTRWHWDSLNYRLSNNVVRNIWSQKNDEDLYDFDDMYASASIPFRYAIIHSPRFYGRRPDEKGFVMIDRLIRWNPKTNEPQMLLFLRASIQPPRYPRVAPETKEGLSDELLPATGS